MRATIASGRWTVVLVVGLTSCSATRTGAGEPQKPDAAPHPTASRPTRVRPAAPVAVAIAAASAPTTRAAGEHFKLKTAGEVFVPRYLKTGAGRVDLVVHFHGAPATVEREFVAAGIQAVLANVSYGGLSRRYEKPFTDDPKLFGTILDETMAGLKERNLVAPAATWGRVCVSSFSAGFGAVRAILKSPEYFDRIDALYLADTLYAGYAGTGAERKVDPDDVKDFRRFAAEAVAGRKTLIITHSYLEPGTYAGTQDTADDMIAFVGAERHAVDEPGPGGMHIVSRADKGQLHVWGCAGKTGEDHMGHLRNMRFGFPKLPLERTRPRP